MLLNFCCSECAGRVSVSIRSTRRRIAERFRSAALPSIMKCFQLVTLVTVIAATSATQVFAQGTNAPLYLLISGGGSVSPLTNGELLEVGQTYNMVALPDAGFAFNSWQPVNVFTLTEVFIEPSGSTSTYVSVTPSIVPTNTIEPSLNFVMQPVVVIYDNPGVSTMTESRGWLANFGPIALDIQLSDSAVILTWTNSSFTLQARRAKRCLHEYFRSGQSLHERHFWTSTIFSTDIELIPG